MVDCTTFLAIFFGGMPVVLQRLSLQKGTSCKRVGSEEPSRGNGLSFAQLGIVYQKLGRGQLLANGRVAFPTSGT